MKIFAINLGSTSTKIAYYEDETCRLKQTIAHSLEDLQHADGIFAQYGFRRRDIENFLAQHGIAVSELDAIVSRRAHRAGGGRHLPHRRGHAR